jgi:hypothetical protein
MQNLSYELGVYDSPAFVPFPRRSLLLTKVLGESNTVNGTLGPLLRGLRGIGCYQVVTLRSAQLGSVQRGVQNSSRRRSSH